MIKIYSPMVSGSGAIIVHNQLAESIEDYNVNTIKPLVGVFPQLIRRIPENTDIVHTAPELAAYIRLTDANLITTFHNYYLDKFMLDRSGRIKRIFYTKILKKYIDKSVRRSKRITVVSDATANLVLQYYPDIKNRLLVIKNGVDENIFKPDKNKEINSEIFNLLFVGNPSSRKGSFILNDLADTLPEQIKITCLLGLRNRKSNLNPEKIRIINSIDHSQTVGLYNQSHLLLFPSVREGLSLVILEAMACGLPVITYNTSSMPEQIDDGKGGILCSMDKPEDLYKSILHLYNNRNKIADMGAYNREKILAEFRLSNTVQRYRELFNDVVFH